ncbi:MAG: GIY-YIG nuclease family protein [Patescibacteria group bacterium]
MYLIESTQHDRWYIGSTGDLRKRLKQHNDGESSYTRKYCPWILLYYEACRSKDDALAREKYLKSGMGRRYLKNRLRRFLSLTG